MNDNHQPWPTRSRGETLDETIDRVAAQLTMVPADPALVKRIADHLGASTFAVWPRLVVAGAVVAAVAIVAVVVMKDARDAVDVARATTSHSSPRVEPPPSVEALAPPTTDAATVATIASQRSVRQRRVPAAVHDPLPEMPQIDALTSPALLAIETLRSDTLTITSVDLAPLDLASLSVTEIDGRDSPKE